MAATSRDAAKASRSVDERSRILQWLGQQSAHATLSELAAVLNRAQRHEGASTWPEFVRAYSRYENLRECDTELEKAIQHAPLDALQEAVTHAARDPEEYYALTKHALRKSISGLKKAIVAAHSSGAHKFVKLSIAEARLHTLQRILRDLQRFVQPHSVLSSVSEPDPCAIATSCPASVPTICTKSPTPRFHCASSNDEDGGAQLACVGLPALKSPRPEIDLLPSDSCGLEVNTSGHVCSQYGVEDSAGCVSKVDVSLGPQLIADEMNTNGNVCVPFSTPLRKGVKSFSHRRRSSSEGARIAALLALPQQISAGLVSPRRGRRSATSREASVDNMPSGDLHWEHTESHQWNRRLERSRTCSKMKVPCDGEFVSIDLHGDASDYSNRTSSLSKRALDFSCPRPEDGCSPCLSKADVANSRGQSAIELETDEQQWHVRSSEALSQKQGSSLEFYDENDVVVGNSPLSTEEVGLFVQVILQWRRIALLQKFERAQSDLEIPDGYQLGKEDSEDGDSAPADISRRNASELRLPSLREEILWLERSIDNVECQALEAALALAHRTISREVADVDTKRLQLETEGIRQENLLLEEFLSNTFRVLKLSSGLEKSNFNCSAQASGPKCSREVTKDIPEVSKDTLVTDARSQEGTFMLEQLTDKRVWEKLDIKFAERETYLPDIIFAELFGMSKEDFSKLPKWKKDGAKKKHGLF